MEVVIPDEPNNIDHQDVDAWVGNGGEIEPYTPPPPAQQTIFSAREFLKRFTIQEYAAARRHENIMVQLALDNLIGAQFVDVTDPDVRAGLDLLVAEGVLTESRRATLLQPEVPE